MIIPIRCFSCGKPLSHDWEQYHERVTGGDSPKDVLDSLGHERYCCRRMFLAHSEIVDEVMLYKRF